MIQRLLPVWGHSRHVAAAKDVGVTWWDEPPLEYGHALISPVHWKREFSPPPGCWIFGDSGGFTLRSPKINLQLDPVAVLRWQAGPIENPLCTVGCILDFPPLGVQKTHRHWERLDTSVAYSLRALPEYLRMRKRGHPFRWWGVLHGNTEEEQEAYYHRVAAKYPFQDEGEGWAVRAEPLVNAGSVARTLRVLKRLGITRAHFLAATGLDVITVLLALGPEAGLEFVSYDSAYAIKMGFNRSLLRPAVEGQNLAEIDLLGEETLQPPPGCAWSTMRETGAEHHCRDFVWEECVCAACVWMRRRTQELERGRRAIANPVFGGWWSTWFQTHNLRIQWETIARQWAVAEGHGREFLVRMLGPGEAARILRIFDGQGPEDGGAIIPPTGSSRSLLGST